MCVNLVRVHAEDEDGDEDEHGLAAESHVAESLVKSTETNMLRMITKHYVPKHCNICIVFFCYVVMKNTRRYIHVVKSR